ncbi:MAG: benzoate/H(+) symporter BenE family transporter, partial [Marmoricola sp.]
MPASPLEADHLQPVSAGVLAALVGFASSFAVVLTGLQAVGASRAEAASGLLALCVAQALGILWLTRRHRIPLVLAWSTPGAALLASSGAVDGGWPAAVGAFLVVGALILLTALWPRLGELIASIPTPIAQAMLAGVLLEICVEPVRVLLHHPWLVSPVLVVWVVLLRLRPRAAVPGAFVATMVVVAVYLLGHDPGHLALAPHVAWTRPVFGWQAVIGLAVPLYVVTMASQNVPGVAVLASFGYRVPWREAMTVTGLGTLAGATAGGHAVNLAAITAAMAASPEAHPDKERRWIAAYTAGWTYLVLAGVS